MRIYNKAILAEQARSLGFLMGPFEKMTRLTGILGFIHASKEMRESLALKGGTAINLTIFDLPRLSVDIDLDFTENLGREETRAKRDRLGGLLERYMAAEGYTKHARSRHSHALDSYVYSYTNVSGNHDNIKVEINYSMRAHVFPAIEVAARTSEVFEPFPVRTLSPVEIFAGKIKAFSERAAARDLYDLNNMVSSNLFSGSDIVRLRKCAVFYMAVSGETNAGGFDFGPIKNIGWRKIRTELLPMIRNAERFKLQPAIERVSSFLNEAFVLGEGDFNFLRQFMDGFYKPELLFEDIDCVKRIESHPMALWRMQQINKQK